MPIAIVATNHQSDDLHHILVDLDDYERVIAAGKWSIVEHRSTHYAFRRISAPGVKPQVNVQMHRFILDVGPEEIVDHVNRNGLDNRRCNLRVCTDSQNKFNQKVRKDSYSGVKGVSLCVTTGRWDACVSAYGKRYRAGRFDSLEEAEAAVTALRLKVHGEYARQK
jgi:hypothetical protein